jgi:hypothetical protein
MKRGDMYRLRHPGGGDAKKQRVMTVMSRQGLSVTHPVHLLPYAVKM